MIWESTATKCPLSTLIHVCYLESRMFDRFASELVNSKKHKNTIPILIHNTLEPQKELFESEIFLEDTFYLTPLTRSGMSDNERQTCINDFQMGSNKCNHYRGRCLDYDRSSQQLNQHHLEAQYGHAP